MKKVISWILNHFVLVGGLLTLAIILGVIGGMMLNSHLSYQAYEKRYDAIDLDVRSAAPAAPGYIEFDNQFKSRYPNSLTLTAQELTVTTSQEEYIVNDYIDLTTSGGKISTKLKLEEKSFVDIDFEVATEYVTQTEDGDEFGIKDLLSNVKFTINGENMEEKGIDLVNEGFNHLIMARFALPAGDVTVEIENLSGKAAMMPQLKGIAFYSTQQLSLAAEE